MFVCVAHMQLPGSSDLDAEVLRWLQLPRGGMVRQNRTSEILERISLEHDIPARNHGIIQTTGPRWRSPPPACENAGNRSHVHGPNNGDESQCIASAAQPAHLVSHINTWPVGRNCAAHRAESRNLRIYLTKKETMDTHDNKTQAPTK